MTRSTRSIILAGIILAGCDSTDVDLRTELQDQHVRWTRLGIDDYSFVLKRSCFCLFDHLGPWRIRVQDGEVVEVTRPDDATAPAPEGVAGETIDDLFDRLEGFLDSEGATLSVSYDARYHFPANAAGDIPFFVDDEFSIEITEFVTTLPGN